jgi:D-methionine transport system substrate-binding protein
MKKHFSKNVTLALIIVTILLTFDGCSRRSQTAEDEKVIKFASHNLKVYADTTKVLAQEVEKLGYKLDYVLLADNTQCNEAVESGEYFANYHQHIPFMEAFNQAHNAHLVPAFKVFVDRAGIFSKKYKNLNDLPDRAKITIDNNAGNSFRGIVMLADAGIIKLKSGVNPANVTPKDIAENPKHIQFIEVDYTMLARALEDADAGFLYATVAVEFGLDINKDALIIEREDLQASDIVTIRRENVGSEKAKILEKAYKSDAMKQAFKDAFDGKDVLLPAW